MPHSATRPIVSDLESSRFEPRDILGEGGSGIVYEALVRGKGEIVALKVLRADLAPSERERRRFLDEARRMQRVDHPGLVKLLEAGLLPDGRPYLAMPRLEGDTLAVRLRSGSLSVRTAVRWFTVLARAVHALHEAGIVHRDVKPENVIIEHDSPVLLDFGIAREIDDEGSTTTAEGRIRGTPAYMAPERFFGAPASVRSDVYELAVVLYMMLVGRLPWGSEKNVTERLDPKSPEDASAEVSAALAAVILRALSTRPEVRPESAEAFAVEVERALAAPSKTDRDYEDRETTDLEALPPPVSEIVPRPRPRSRWMVGSVLVVALASAAFAASRLAPSSSPLPSVGPVTSELAPREVSASALPSLGLIEVPSSLPSMNLSASARPPVKRTPKTTTSASSAVREARPQASSRSRSDEAFFEDRH